MIEDAKKSNPAPMWCLVGDGGSEKVRERGEILDLELFWCIERKSGPWTRATLLTLYVALSGVQSRLT